MKNKITLKQGRAMNPFSIGFCDAQYLLGTEEPFAYSAGINGWYCDYYKIDGIVIAAGYMIVGQDVPYNIVSKYAKQAEEKCRAYDYEGRKKVLTRFVQELMNLVNTSV